MSTAEMKKLCAEIASAIADYRAGEIAKPTRDHVDRWINQFDPADCLPVLSETAHLIQKVYASKEAVAGFIGGLIKNKGLTGEDPQNFWRSVGFLRLQSASQSQNDFLTLLDEALKAEFGISTEREKSKNGVYIYLDDAIFSGTQVRNDISEWLKPGRIKDATVHVIVAAYHKSGQWYANREIEKIAKPLNVSLQWWRAMQLEDWRKNGNENVVEVLWPSCIPDDPNVTAWLKAVPEDKRYFNARQATGQPNQFFSSNAGREALEQAFLRKGAYIRSLPRDASEKMRPLGYSNLKGFGFGTMFATYRNCPNNCPLVLWWGDPKAGEPLNKWYPLLPRRVRRADAAIDLDVVGI